MFIADLNKKLLQDLQDFLSEMKRDGQATGDDIKKLNFERLYLGPPKNKSFGDLTTNAGMFLSSLLKKPPMEVSALLVEEIFNHWPEAGKIYIAAPGFINFNLKQEYIKNELVKIARQGKDYGSNDTGGSARIQIEFVSANPTGSLHIGHGRWAALGDSLSNIYEKNGFEVCREYYVNDYGSQIQKFASCISCLYLRFFKKEIPYPEDGYPESSLSSLAGELISKYGSKFLKDGSGPLEADTDALGCEGINIMIARIKKTLASMGVVFDCWFFESSLYQDNNFEKSLEELEKKELVYEKENALWFKSGEYGDEKDRVVIRSGGEPTYFASDILYLADKISRGFLRLIYILGADHHGYIKRLKAIGSAMGFDGEKVEVIIGQLVRLVKKGQAVKMSKRKGSFYGLDELIKEVGRDPVRYFFTANSFDTPMDFDIDLARKKSNQNPVYYIQYAHARISNVMVKVRELFLAGELKTNKREEGLQEALKIFQQDFPETGNKSQERFELIMEHLASSLDFKEIKLEDDDELELARNLIYYPDIIYDACKNNAPYLVNQYLYKTASLFHYFYNHHRVIDKGVINSSRFKLILLTRIVLANAMEILRITAPLKM